MGRLKLRNKKKKRFKIKIMFLTMMFISSLYFMFQYLVSSDLEITDKRIVEYLLKDYNDNKIVEDEVLKKLSSLLDINNILSMDKPKEKEVAYVSNETGKPLVYIYNSHQTEEYKKETLAEFAVSPTVFVADYIMQDRLKQNKIDSIVEEKSVTEIRKINGWNYSGCYRASRVLMEEAFKNNSSLKYFIDIHRDSLDRGRTTINIEGREFAKIIFLIGLENPNYQENLNFTEIINNKINEKYPGLSKGIYKKGGEGVNGVYNQDFSKYTILIEIGGEENTITEVMNTTLVISDVISEVILENEK